jgi:serine/threonine protein kinase
VSSEGEAKLSDFGASRKIEESNNDTSRLNLSKVTELCRSLKGSPYWMAPEVVKRSGHSLSADIWSLGCLTIEMLTGKPTWAEHGNNPQVILNLLREAHTPPPCPFGITE